MLHEIPYYEPQLNTTCYQNIMNGFFGEIQLQMPQIFIKQCAAIEQSYHERYMSWLSLQNTQQHSLQNMLDKFHDSSPEVRKLLEKAIVNQRYAPDFHLHIEKFIQNTSPTTKLFLKAVNYNCSKG